MTEFAFGPPPDAFVALLTAQAERWEHDTQVATAQKETPAFSHGYALALTRCASDLRKCIAEMTAVPSRIKTPFEWSP